MKKLYYLISSEDEGQDNFIDFHDKCIGQIILLSDRIRFVFSDGFRWIKPSGVVEYSFGYMDFMGITTEDVFCYMIHPQKNRFLLSPAIKTLSIERLNRIIVRKKLYIEVFLELSSETHYHLRGELRSRFYQKKCYKHTTVIIEMMEHPLKLYFGELSTSSP